jgi:hypothetical protein
MLRAQTKCKAIDHDIKAFKNKIIPLCKLGLSSPWNSNKTLLVKEYYKSNLLRYRNNVKEMGKCKSPLSQQGIQ